MAAPSTSPSHLGNSTDDNYLAYDLPLASPSKPTQASSIVSNPSTHLNLSNTNSFTHQLLSSPQDHQLNMPKSTSTIFYT